MAARAFVSNLLVAFAVIAVGFILPISAAGQGDNSTPYRGIDTLQSQTPAASNLPLDVVEAVWEKIDANQDGRATDREAYAAIKPVRVIGNSKLQSELRDNLRKAADKNEDDLIVQSEALAVIAKVRGVKCPTAKRVRTYFDRLDKDRSGALSPDEMRNTLAPLGNVGKALFQPVAITVKSMDLTEDNTIDTDELYLSANAMLRVQLATDGPGIAQRDPGDWLKFVNAVAYMDVDADNQVSLIEAAQIKAIGGQFARIDRDSNRQLSIGELCEFQENLDLQAYLSSSVGGS